VNDLLKQLRADMRDRQTLTFMLVGAVALVVAVAWIALGSHAGSSATPPPQVAAVPPVNVANGTDVSDKHKLARREARRRRLHRHHTAHTPQDPFTPLEKAPAEKSTSGTTGETKFGASAPSESSTSGGKATKKEPVQQPDSHPTVVSVRYNIAIEYNAQSEGAPFQLELGKKLSLKAATPSSAPVLFWLDKVDSGGASATFNLGKGVKRIAGGECLPSVKRCEMVLLKPKQLVQLEWVRSGEAPVVFQVLLRSISRSGAAVASYTPHPSNTRLRDSRLSKRRRSK